MRRKRYETRRLIIRPLTRNDEKRWTLASKTALSKQDKFDVYPLMPRARPAYFINKAVIAHKNLARQDEAYIWNVFLKTTGEVIGWVDISIIKRDPYQMANLGYFIASNHRRKGFSTEVIKCIVEAAFKDLKLHRLEAVIDLDNKASIKTAGKAGLKKEGLKKHYWHQNKKWEDQMIFIATPELWEKNPKKK